MKHCHARTTAFHGSLVADLDSIGFSLEHIGTGQGSSVMAHGLYFSTDRDRADWYRLLQAKAITPPRPGNFSLNGTVFTAESGTFMKGNSATSREEFSAAWRAAQEDFERRAKQGYLYKASLPSRHDLLDDCAALSEQAESVQRALLAAIEAAHGPDWVSPSRLSRVLSMPGAEAHRFVCQVFGDDKAANSTLARFGVAGLWVNDRNKPFDRSASATIVIWDPAAITNVECVLGQRELVADCAP